MNKLILLILFSLSYCNAVIGQDSHIHFIEKPDSQKISIYIDEGTEKVSLQLFKELNLHIACILFGYVQIFSTLMP